MYVGFVFLKSYSLEKKSKLLGFYASHIVPCSSNGYDISKSLSLDCRDAHHESEGKIYDRMNQYGNTQVDVV